MLKKGNEQILTNISVQDMYLSIKQHTQAFERMGIKMSNVDKEVIDLDSSEEEEKAPSSSSSEDSSQQDKNANVKSN